MAYPDKAGKKFNSKFRANKSDKMSAVNEGMKSEKPSGNRAQANKIEAKGREESTVQPGEASGEPSPNSLAGQTEPRNASQVTITHDEAAGTHHVHAVNPDGTEAHSDHASRAEAHFHGAMAAGADPDTDQEEAEMQAGTHKRKQPSTDPMDADDYQVEPLENN